MLPEENPSMFRPVYAVLGAAALLVAASARAADVKVTGIHNCCPACTKAINSTLEGAGAKGVVLKGNEVSFSADDAEKAVKALYDAGFAVKAEGVKTPGIDGAKGVKGKDTKVEAVHNCCGSCTRAINAAIKGVGTSAVKPRETSFTVTSENEVQAEDVVKALRAAGFNARVAR